MALIDEELVEYWLNNKGFFCMRGVKVGLGEIDFLAIRPIDDEFECWHVEVTVSFRPIGYIGGDSSAKRRNTNEIEQGVKQYIRKKFTSDEKTKKKHEILPNAIWKHILVCAEVRCDEELEQFMRNGIVVNRYKDILAELEAGNSQVNSTAGNIVEILRYKGKQK